MITPMRGLPRAAAWLLLLQAWATVAACSPAETDPVDIVVISLDTTNRSALRAYAPEAPPLPAMESGQ